MAQVSLKDFQKCLNIKIFTNIGHSPRHYDHAPPGTSKLYGTNGDCGLRVTQLRLVPEKLEKKYKKGISRK
jgi:hypothetical protein